METVVFPVLAPGEKRLVLLTHDESFFESNDGTKTIWIEQGKTNLRLKGLGKSFKVLQFLCQCHGCMKIEVNEELLQRYPSIVQSVGMVSQILKINKAGKDADRY